MHSQPETRPGDDEGFVGALSTIYSGILRQGRDLSGIISAALVETAVEHGDVYALTVVRPGSWESADVRHLAAEAGYIIAETGGAGAQPGPVKAAVEPAVRRALRSSVLDGAAHAIGDLAVKDDAEWKNTPEGERAGYLVHQAYLEGLDTAADTVRALIDANDPAGQPEGVEEVVEAADAKMRAILSADRDPEYLRGAGDVMELIAEFTGALRAARPGAQS